MASTIDSTKPIAGNPTTDSVRVNFAAAKAEIEALQSDVAALTAGTVPDASETVKGIVEIATAGEVTTGTDPLRVITPARLTAWVGSTNISTVGTINSGTWNGTTIATGKLPAASTAASGIVELADVSETNSGLSSSLAVTPAGLTAWTGDTAITTVGTIGTGTWNASVIAAAKLPAATTTDVGVVELADVSETNSGLSSTLAVTPAGLTAWTGDTAITTVGTIGTGVWNATVIDTTKLPAATTGAQGAVAIATAAEIDTGSNNTKAASPLAIAGSTRFLNRSSLTLLKSGNYTIAAADNGYDIILTTGTFTFTIPAGLPVGFQFTATKAAGTLYITSSTDTTNGSTGTKTVNSAWSTVYCLKYDTGKWILSGDIV